MLGSLTPALTCACWGVHLQDDFLTGASNNHSDSFLCFLSFSSFCALHRFWRARSDLSCYLPLFVPFPRPSFFPILSFVSAQGGIGWRGSVLL